ncbi:MAG: hypothetical protein CVV64_11215 [Candidatus Wallbacteria bacterium HGW-Wallbacteria-1]|jgi:uncharacterized Zn finger protein|uniref:SWIM-type domain-containing protein n=1 Tax=Candidatus Wallbacteria bacterium HGW-Wallbacteria-1 TaxID=2013854 RepID=A0A2N1PP36_9BACT|nr:MAG: hypothetical protein CVV64_11215 [Candidatus Wallbacteria bacterium HGW-Wallbacteria-1]
MILKDMNGIRARTRKGSFGRNWWSEYFSDLFEKGLDRIEIRKGRNSARSGGLVKLELESGKISFSFKEQVGSIVRGSLSPKRNVDLMSGELINLLSTGSLNISFLMAGSMAPESMEIINHCLLGDNSENDNCNHEHPVIMKCSCGEGTMPCRHVLAAAYITAESMDSDPFLLLDFLGIQKDVLLDRALPSEVTDKRHLPDDSIDEETSREIRPEGKSSIHDRFMPMAENFWHPGTIITENQNEEPGLDSKMLQEIIAEISNGWAGDLDPAVELKSMYARSAAWATCFNES